MKPQPPPRRKDVLAQRDSLSVPRIVLEPAQPVQRDGVEPVSALPSSSRTPASARRTRIALSSTPEPHSPVLPRAVPDVGCVYLDFNGAWSGGEEAEAGFVYSDDGGDDAAAADDDEDELRGHSDLPAYTDAFVAADATAVRRAAQGRDCGRPTTVAVRAGSRTRPATAP